MKMQNAVTKSGYDLDQEVSSPLARQPETATVSFEFNPKDSVARATAELTKSQSFSRFIEAVHARR